ncbi:M48 family metallopeptidase [Lachnospiraceae bacterium Oil+RF-744-WCA-WT-13]|uniref:M48 family metallopeptidase n=2 Tax=Bilifractor porci TaxID=2606636 RepID=A0A7X2P7V8_9FIRM|nr:M48 family metallopeptidase [Bilifractor porci]
MAMEICPDGSLLVRAPLRASVKEIRQFVCSHEGWVIKQRNRMKKETDKLREAEKHPLSPEDIRHLADQALRELPPRIAAYAGQMGVTYGRVTIRNQKTLWGSCSSKGNLNFNCLLMLAPREVQDYVIVHELSHRKEMNHSPKFWEEVEKVLPDYKRRRNWLRENGSAVIRRMTAGCAVS